MNCCTNVGYVSLMRRCDSFAIVANTRDDLPDPLTPVKTVSRRFGISTLMFFRLFSRAPTTRITSCESAMWADAAAMTSPRSVRPFILARTEDSILPQSCSFAERQGMSATTFAPEGTAVVTMRVSKVASSASLDAARCRR